MSNVFGVLRASKDLLSALKNVPRNGAGADSSQTALVKRHVSAAYGVATGLMTESELCWNWGMHRDDFCERNCAAGLVATVSAIATRTFERARLEEKHRQIVRARLSAERHPRGDLLWDLGLGQTFSRVRASTSSPDLRCPRNSQRSARA